MWSKTSPSHHATHKHEGTSTARVNITRLVKGTEISSNYIEGESGSMIDWINKMWQLDDEANAHMDAVYELLRTVYVSL